MRDEAFDERRRALAQAVRDLGAVASAAGARSLASGTCAELVHKLEEDRFHVAVVGEYNHGKTTLVNALLGAAVLPTGPTPTTAVVHLVEHAESPRARIVHADGRTESADPADLGRLAVPSLDRAPADVRAVEVGWPAPLLRDGVVIVDTPGVNDLSFSRAEVTEGYLPRADVILFVLDAGQLFKASERRFVEERVGDLGGDRVVFVVNKADGWTAAQRAEAMRWLEARLGEAGAAGPAWAVSAEAALRGDRASSGVPELEAHVGAVLARSRGRLLIEGAAREAQAAADAALRAVRVRHHAASLAPDDIERRIARLEAERGNRTRTLEERRARLREEGAALRAVARADLDHFVEDVVDQLPALVDAAPADDLRVWLGPFLEHAFRTWAADETAEIARAIDDLAERSLAVVREELERARRTLSEAAAAPVPLPAVAVDTFAYDVGIFALFTVGLGAMFSSVILGGLLALAAPVLAVWVRDKIEVETRRRAKEIAPAALRDAAARVRPRIEAMVDDLVGRIDAWLAGASPDVERDALEVLAAVRSERAGGAGPDAVRAPCAEAAERIQAARARLEAAAPPPAG